MNDWVLDIYHKLPSSARSVVASLRGYYLKSWRYDQHTSRLTEQALEREDWTPEQWLNWQQERLSFILHRAVTRVPYYREYWAERRRRGDKTSWEYLEHWPVLKKDAVRLNPEAFVADDCNITRMFYEHTSGTTGKPLKLWWSHETVRNYYALTEARCRVWNGVNRKDRWAIIGGQLVTPVKQRKPPFWVWNKGLNQLYMSSYHLAPDLMESYLEAIVNYRVTYLHGYTSSLYALAQAAIRSGRRDIRMTVVLTNAEPVYDYQRSLIAQAFNCPVRESYGMAEIVATASECNAEKLHLWPEIGWVEVMEKEHPLGSDRSGSLVCTGLLNADMPLIRYHTGDGGALARANESGECQCGRALPVLSHVEGREDDSLLTVDGRRIGRLDPLFKDNLPICEAQIIQEALDSVRVRYVPTSDFRTHHEREIAERLRARMGNMKIIMEPLAEVPREANGKFRAVINKLSKEERATVCL